MKLINWLVCTAFFVLPLSSMAQDGLTAKWVNLRAGPARDYPLVARLPPDTPVFVQGCMDDYSWCDVATADNLRGWLYARNITFDYQGQAVPIIEFGAVIGFPIVPFIIGNYWEEHYRDRPWYPDESRWRDRPYHRRPALPAPDFNRPHDGRWRPDQGQDRGEHPHDNQPPGRRPTRPDAGIGEDRTHDGSHPQSPFKPGGEIRPRGPDSYPRGVPLPNPGRPPGSTHQGGRDKPPGVAKPPNHGSP